MIKLNLQQPINLSVISMVVIFPLSIMLLYLLKPTWVHKVLPDGSLTLSWNLVISFSITFALVSSIGALIFSSSHISKLNDVSTIKPVAAYSIDTSAYSFPSTDMAYAYCGYNKHA